VGSLPSFNPKTTVTDSVLITGAGTGLGLEMSLYLAQKGFTVYATIPLESQREHVAREATRRGVSLRLLTLDVTDQDSIQAALHTVISECGGLFALVNNAGISLRGYFEDCSDEEIRQVFKVNVYGAMAVTRCALPHMRRAGRGRLIFISSIAARITAMARAAYCASKFSLEGFAESLSQEVAAFGLHAVIIEPAVISTERWTTHRGVAENALNPDSCYYSWFLQEERLADRLVRTSPTRPAHVARAVHRALQARRPRLRYIVGRRARIAVLLRRYLPGELFERIVFGQVIRRVTQIQRSQG
jgi:NAD(P)-dependent dehydrogenase (short-subunit alcohol dehydrogenase family)